MSGLVLSCVATTNMGLLNSSICGQSWTKGLFSSAKWQQRMTAMCWDPENDCQITEVWMQHGGVYVIGIKEEKELRRKQANRVMNLSWSQCIWKHLLDFGHSGLCWLTLTVYDTILSQVCVLVFLFNLRVCSFNFVSVELRSNGLGDKIRKTGSFLCCLLSLNSKASKIFFSTAPFRSIKNIHSFLAHPSLSERSLWRTLPSHPHNKSVLVVKPLIHTSQI